MNLTQRIRAGLLLVAASSGGQGAWWSATVFDGKKEYFS
jgi:hypothetical protein